MSKRTISDAKVKEVLTLKDKGFTHRQISSLCNVSVGSVSRIFNSNAEHPKRLKRKSGPRGITVEQKARMVEAYENGMTQTQIAKLFDVSPMTVNTAVKKAGKSKGRGHRQIDDATLAKIIMLAKMGMSQELIAEEAGVSRPTVAKHARAILDERKANKRKAKQSKRKPIAKTPTPPVVEQNKKETTEISLLWGLINIKRTS